MVTSEQASFKQACVRTSHLLQRRAVSDGLQQLGEGCDGRPQAEAPSSFLKVSAVPFFFV